MSKYIELAKKLKALADRGIGGEKTNAEKMLKDLLGKHNLSLDDIEGEKIEMHYFNLDKAYKDLWGQIVKSVNSEIGCYGEFPKNDIKKFNLQGNYCAKCTPSEYIEIEAKLGIFIPLYKSELDIFYTAFCTANDLLVKPKKQKSASDLSPEEYEKWKRSQDMATKIKSEQYRKQIAP